MKPGPKSTIISEELYEKAEKNGISYDRVYARIVDLGWDEERAVTEPVRKRTLDYYSQQARANGIRLETYRRRVARGMDPEKACMLPLVKGGKAKKDPELQHWLKVAEVHGIAPATFRYRRYHLRWSYDKAATHPLRHRQIKRP